MRAVIVDDSEINILLMEALVRKQGCGAECFSASAAALERCIAEDIDLVIVDYMMPAPDGLEFIRRLRAAPGRQDVPILMVTAAHARDVRYQALEAGATDFLNKPLDTVEFGLRVKNMLALRSSHLVIASRADTLAAEVKKATATVHERERETVYRLARAAEFRDPETGGHIQRMAHYSVLIAEHLGWDEDARESLLLAAPMHDVGKVGTPDSILLKPARLTPEEFEIMKRHTTMGWEILKGSTSPILQLAAQIAVSHHEKFDGSGYPYGLRDEDIPWAGRVVAVADVFDALTSARPYKEAWEVGRAVAELQRGRGAHFDPVCVDAFVAELPRALEVQRVYQDEVEEPAPRPLRNTG
jgi:response regulator RpfG family c-di-GMP phosphodiesterase